VHESTRRALVRYATRHGLVGGVPVLAGVLFVLTRLAELTARSYLFFAGLSCLVLGVIPFLLAGHIVSEHPIGAEAVDVGRSGQHRYKLGFAFLTAGAYAFGAFAVLGQL
jgi:hypothetical protein